MAGVHALIASWVAAPPDNAVTQLAERGLFASPERWTDRLVAGTAIDGAEVGQLLLRLTNSFRPAKTLPEAVDVLARRGDVGSPAYWKTQAVAGKTCDGKNVAAVVVRAAAR